MLGSLRKYGGGGNKIEISDWMGGGGNWIRLWILATLNSKFYFYYGIYGLTRWNNIFMRPDSGSVVLDGHGI